MALQELDTPFADFKVLVSECIDDELSDHGVAQLEDYLDTFCASHDEKIDACNQFLAHVIARVPDRMLQAFVTNYMRALEAIASNPDDHIKDLVAFSHQLHRWRPETPVTVRSGVMKHILAKRRANRHADLPDNGIEQVDARHQHSVTTQLPSPRSSDPFELYRDSSDGRAVSEEIASSSIGRNTSRWQQYSRSRSPHVSNEDLPQLAQDLVTAKPPGALEVAKHLSPTATQESIASVRPAPDSLTQPLDSVQPVQRKQQPVSAGVLDASLRAATGKLSPEPANIPKSVAKKRARTPRSHAKPGTSSKGPPEPHATTNKRQKITGSEEELDQKPRAINRQYQFPSRIYDGFTGTPNRVYEYVCPYKLVGDNCPFAKRGCHARSWGSKCNRSHRDLDERRAMRDELRLDHHYQTGE
ncbi:MAG: hypothetical protein Q9170_005082 [Blastenia crenularia]